jgi:pimeloyl-ACP methyl ester carboxylesterase
VAATYGAAQAGSAPALIVVVHGDVSSGGPADYHFAFTRSLAKPGVVAVALVRPGYSDAAGRTSQGTHYDRRDSYTPANITAVGSAVRALKTHYKARTVIYVGHSGGAAIGGVLIGKDPGLINGAVLVSCPCDITRWREERKRGAWTRSESPSAYAAKVPTTTRVVAITGSTDDNTGPGLARGYVESLTKRGVKARFQNVPGAGHGFSALHATTSGAIAGLL